MPSLRLAVVSLFLAAHALPAQQVDSLLAADRALADIGFPDAIQRAASDVVLVYPGAPVVQGLGAARQIIDAQPAMHQLAVRWVPLFGAVSTDGTFGVTWGVTAIVDPTQAPLAPRFGKYLSAWRMESDGWKLVGHVQVAMVASSAFVMPPGFTVPSLGTIQGPAAAMASADIAFAAMAGSQGAEAAFGEYVAPEGHVFGGGGELARGPEAVRAQFAGNRASWAWHPVVAMSSAAGDLGFTVGEATIIPPGRGPSYTKYLTLWQRQPDGRIRFLADGGNGRPAPAR